MRVALRATMDTERANEARKSGRMQEVIGQVMERLKPEAAYFLPTDGKRSCFIVFEMRDSAELPPIVEPFFQEFGAHVEIQPVMTGEDLRKGLAEVARG